MTSPLRRALGAVVDWLDGTPWYLFGAHALGLHAIPRQTLDIDVTVTVEPDALGAFIERLARHGLSARAEEPLVFAERFSVIPVVHIETGITVDVVLAGTRWEAQALERIVEREFLGRRIPVISAEDQLLGKLSSERERDVDDARTLVATLGDELDYDYIIAGLREREVAFDRSDLVTDFEDLLARYRQRAAPRGH